MSVRGAAPLAWRQPREGEEAIAGFFEAIGHRPTLEPPLADEGLATALDLRRCRGVNHVRVVGGDLLVQTLGRVRQQVPVLVHGAALDRHATPDRGDGPLQSLPAIRDQELGAAQATTDEIMRTPRQASLLSPPMLLTASNTFWPSVRTPMA